MAKQIRYSEPAEYFPKEIRDKFKNAEKEKKSNTNSTDKKKTK